MSPAVHCTSLQFHAVMLCTYLILLLLHRSPSILLLHRCTMCVLFLLPVVRNTRGGRVQHYAVPPLLLTCSPSHGSIGQLGTRRQVLLLLYYCYLQQIAFIWLRILSARVPECWGRGMDRRNRSAPGCDKDQSTQCLKKLSRSGTEAYLPGCLRRPHIRVRKSRAHTNTKISPLNSRRLS